MPIIKSAKKQARADVRKHKKNLQVKTVMKRAINDFKKSPTGAKFVKAQSEIDKATKKGILKKNTAARRKAGLVRIAKTTNTKPVVGTAKKTVAKKPVAKTVAKPTAKKTIAKTDAKPVAKKSAVKKVATKKPATKKTTAKKA